MTDWADEAELLLDAFYEIRWDGSTEFLAVAARLSAIDVAAEKRGRVAGLREAAEWALDLDGITPKGLSDHYRTMADKLETGAP